MSGCQIHGRKIHGENGRRRGARDEKETHMNTSRTARTRPTREIIVKTRVKHFQRYKSDTGDEKIGNVESRLTDYGTTACKSKGPNATTKDG